MTRFANTHKLSEDNTLWPDIKNMSLDLGPNGSHVIIHASPVDNTRIAHSRSRIDILVTEEELRSLRQNPAFDPSDIGPQTVMATTRIAVPRQYDRIEALKLLNPNSLKVDPQFEFGTLISEDKTRRENSDFSDCNMVVHGPLRADRANLLTKDRRLQVPSLEAGHGELRITGEGDIEVDKFFGKSVNGMKGDLIAASEIGNITIVEIDANDLKLEVATEGNILTGPTNANTARLITFIGDILSDGLQSRLSLRCATDRGDIVGDFGFPSDGASIQTLKGVLALGIVGDSRTGGKFMVTNHDGETKITLARSSAIGAPEYFQGTLEVICPQGRINLNGTPESGYAKMVFGNGESRISVVANNGDASVEWPSEMPISQNTLGVASRASKHTMDDFTGEDRSKHSRAKHQATVEDADDDVEVGRNDDGSHEEEREGTSIIQERRRDRR